MTRRAIVLMSVAVLVGAALAGAGLGLSMGHSRGTVSEQGQQRGGEGSPSPTTGSASSVAPRKARKASRPREATTGSVPLLGVSVATKALLAQDTAEFGHLPILREYYTHLPSANAWTTGLQGANKSAVIVSFFALPSAILSGADDAVLSHFFDTAPTGYPIYYCYIHEPEPHIADGQFTAAAYKAAWARVVALADAAHNPYLHSTLILEAYDLEPGADRDWKNYLPGGHIISVLGWDAYPVGTGADLYPQLTPPTQMMGPAIAASKSVGLPYGFAEFGLSVPNGRPAWLTEVGNYLMHSGALFGSLFNATIVTNGRTMDLAGDAPAIAVWRHFVTVSDELTGNE